MDLKDKCVNYSPGQLLYLEAQLKQVPVVGNKNNKKYKRMRQIKYNNNNH